MVVVAAHAAQGVLHPQAPLRLGHQIAE
jgi:hypothetical protein